MKRKMTTLDRNCIDLCVVVHTLNLYHVSKGRCIDPKIVDGVLTVRPLYGTTPIPFVNGEFHDGRRNPVTL
jgi:hypothetical protein